MDIVIHHIFQPKRFIKNRQPDAWKNGDHYCRSHRSRKNSSSCGTGAQLQTEIISADSRQCYKELKIGVARPSEKELQLVPHHFIASHSIHEKLDAAVFENYALQKAAQIFQHHDYAVMVGGTGLYIRAFCEGMATAIPAIPEEIRNEISQAYAQQGLSWLQRNQVSIGSAILQGRRNTQPPPADACP